MVKKIRLTRTSIKEFVPDPAYYADCETIEDMAKQDANSDDRDLMFEECTVDKIDWEIIDDEESKSGSPFSETDLTNIEFGFLLRSIRKESGLSQRVLAEKTGIDFTYISHIERGKTPPPSEDTLIKMALALNYDKDLLLCHAGKFPSDLIKFLSQNPKITRYVRELSESPRYGGE